MLEWYYLAQAARVAKEVPKELVVIAGAYFLITDIHKRHCQTKLEETRNFVRLAEIKLETLKIEQEMKADPPPVEVVP